MKDNQQSHQTAENIIAGKNAVAEALSSGREIDSVYLLKGSGNSAAKVIALAKKAGIPIKETTAQKLDAMAEGVNHQGVVATVAAHSFSTVEEILARAGEEPPFLIIADSIEDPHNLGAIIRTAEAAGAHGIIIPKRRGVSLTATVAKTSAGAIEYLPVARVSNLVATVKDLKKKGIWVYGADMEGQSWCQTDLKGGVALVIGSEGEGISRLLKEECDFTLSLPMNGRINSLNASVAAGILMYEIARQRLGLAAQ